MAESCIFIEQGPGVYTWAEGFKPVVEPSLSDEAREHPFEAISHRISRAALLFEKGKEDETDALEREAREIFRLVTAK